jgi:hypothetical protein
MTHDQSKAQLNEGAPPKADQPEEQDGALASKLFDKVKKQMGWDDLATGEWFLTRNVLFGELSPIEFMRRYPDRAEQFINFVIDEKTDPGPRIVGPTEEEVL